ncbi:MAG: hypothetical protein U9N02_03510 [Campylobacterota bacterium]|nr:hypothetical protein [Campylobacterota bacterium]
MKKIIFITLLVATTVFSDNLKLSLNTLNMNYVETADNGAFLDSETSNYIDIVGAGIKYNMPIGDSFIGADENSLEFAFDYLSGQSFYNGSFQDGTPHTTNSDMDILDTKIRFIETKKESLYDMSIFSSLGYRF